jgi:aryl-phospho-beta-D-glucosidase BglC (GH1 family)
MARHCVEQIETGAEHIEDGGSAMLIGVNLSGAEFGDPLPGTYGVDYTYPTHAEVDYYAAKGMSVIRLPFMWERLQHTEFGALDATELGRLDDFVNYATGKGLKVDLNPQDFGYGFGHLIGSAETPNSAFADFWGKVAAHFKTNPNVIFGLMNEPHDQSATTWLGSVNAAITAIRNTGATQEILVPGSYWDGAWTWTTTDNAAVIGTGVHDPLHNYAFEVHQYLDPDGSGTQPGAASTTLGVERLTAITQWAESTGNHLFLGEVGVSTDPTSLTALDLMLDYIGQHAGAWQGATYWAGGPWWDPGYMFSIEPEGGVDKPQMKILVDHLPSVGTPISATQVQADYLAITRTALPLAQATSAANSISAGTTTETKYVSGLLSQVANTTIPAVAVEATMYGLTGSSAEITKLATQFLPDQVANAMSHGYNPQVYACEALGLALAFNDENGGTGFAANFGPSKSTMPNTTAGDAAFAAAAASTIFGSAATANTPAAIAGFVANWKAFFTANGVAGIANATPNQIDLAARGAAWGDAVGIAFDNNLGPLPGQVINFLDDAAQGTALYHASLVGQPIHHAFLGA